MKTIYLIALSLLFQISQAQTNSWKGTTSTSWGTASNWSLNLVPTSTHDVIIGDANFTGNNQPALSSSSSCKSLIIGGTKASILTMTSSRGLTVYGNITIATNGTLIHGSSSRYGNLTVKGNFINNGTYTAAYGKTTVLFNGTNQQIGGSTSTVFRRININASSNVSLTNNISTTGTSTPSISVTGILNPSTYLITGTSGITVNSGGKIYIYNATFDANYGLSGTRTFNPGSTVEYASPSVTQTISNFSYTNLIFSGNSKKILASNLNALVSTNTLYGNITVNAGVLDISTYTINRGTSTTGGKFIVANGATLRIGGTSSFPLNYATKDLDINSTIEYYGNNQTIATLSYGNLTLSGTSGTVTKTLPSTAINIRGNFLSTVGSATSVSFTALNNITFSQHATIGSNTTFNAASFTHSFSDSVTFNGTVTGSTSTINFTGDEAFIDGTGTINLNNVNIAGLSIDVASTTNFSISGNLATTGAGGLTHAAGGTITMSGTNKSISGNNITLSNLITTGTITTNSSFIVSGNLTVNGTSFTASAGIINFTGASKTISGTGSLSLFGVNIAGSISTTRNLNIANNLNIDGSFTATAGTITFTNISSLSGIADLYNVTVNGTSFTLSTDAELYIKNVFTLTSGNFDATSNIPNKVVYNGSSSQTIISTSYYILETSTGGAKTAGGNLTITGDLVIGNLTTFNASTYSHTISRFLYNNGTFNANTSTITFNGLQVSHIYGNVTFYNLVVNKSLNIYALELSDNNASATNVTVTMGRIETKTNTLTITGSRNGNGYIYGTIKRQHSFITGVAYSFEGPYNTITFSNVSGVTSITVKVSLGLVTDFPSGGAINREYSIAIPVGSYTANVRLHYEDAELNGNNETRLDYWKNNTTSWNVVGKTSYNSTNNYVDLNNQSSLNGRWTLSDDYTIVAWNGNTNNDWNTASNWTIISGAPNTPPQATDIVQLGSMNHTYSPIITTNVTVKSIQFLSNKETNLNIENGGVLNVVGNISGQWSNNATHNINIGANTATINGSLFLSDSVNNHNININISTGTLNVLQDIYLRNTSTVNFTNAGTININGNFFSQGGTFNAATSTVNYIGSSYQAVGALNYYNIGFNKSDGLAETYLEGASSNVYGNFTVLGNSVVDMDQDWHITGNLSIGSNAKFYMDHSFVHIYLAGDLINNGFMSTDGGTLILDGSKNQSISAAPIYNLSINKTSGIVSLLGNLSIKGNVSIQSGTLDITTKTINRNTVGGIFSLASGTSLILGANNFPANYSTYSINNSSNIIYNGSTTQSIAASTYGNLILSNGIMNAKSLIGNITINGDFTVNNNSTFNAGNYTIDLNGNLTNYGNIALSNNTINLKGINKEINGNTFALNNVNVSGSYLIKGIDLTFEGLLNSTKSGSFNLGTGTITINNNFHNSGTLISNGVVNFTGTKVQNIEFHNTTNTYFNGTTNFNGTVAPTFNSNATPYFNNLNINNTSAGGISPSMNWIITGNFTTALGATFNGSVATHSFAGNITNNGSIIFTTGTLFLNPTNTVNISLGNKTIQSNGTIELGGNGLMNITGSFGTINNLYISNTHTNGVTLTNSLTVNNDLLIKPNGILNAGSYTHNVIGNFENQGILNANTSTFIFTGLESTVASGLSSFNNIEIKGVILPEGDLNLNGNLTIATNGKLINNELCSINFTGDQASRISSASSPFYFSNINIQKSSASAVVSLAVNLDSISNLNINSGKLDIDTFNLIEEPLAGMLQIDSAATLKIGGTKGLPIFTAYNLDSLSIIEYGGTTQSISNNISYGSIKISGSEIKTATGSLTILGNYEQTGGVFNVGSFTHEVYGNWYMTSGTFNSTGSTIIFSGNQNQTIQSVSSFENVVINNNSTVTLNSNIQINNQLTLTSGLLKLNDKTLILNGPAIAGNINNLVTSPQSGLSFGGSFSNISIPSFINELGNLIINNSNGIGLNNSLKVNNNLTLSTGILNLKDSTTLTIAGNHIRTNGTLGTTKKSNLIVTGTGSTFHDLAFATSKNSISNFYLGRSIGIENSNGVNIYGVLSFINSHVTLNTNSIAGKIGLTMKSTPDSTARIASMENNGLDGLTITENKIIGNVLVERYISGSANRAWRLLGPTVTTTTTIRDNWQEGTNNPNTTTNNNPNPGYGCYITGAGGNAKGFDVTQSNSASLYNYSATTDSWITVPNTNATTLDAKKGYLLYIRGGRDNLSYLNGSLASGNTTLRTIGALLTGTQTFTDLNTTDGMFSLVTNPYAAPLNWTSVIQDPLNSSNFTSSYTFWDPNIGTRGAYVTINSNGLANAGIGNANIQTGQAFFVQRKAGAISNTLTIKETHKANNNSIDVFRINNEVATLRTSLYFVNSDNTSKLADGTLSLFNNNFNYDIDDNDAEQLDNWDEDITIFHKGKKLSIDCRPNVTTVDTIQLEIARLRTMNYKWEFKAENFNVAGFTAYLEDNYPTPHQTQINLEGTTVITFSATADAASKASNRFKIIYKKTTALPVNIVSLKAYKQKDEIKIEWKTENEININNYIVEKSNDGINFTAIGNVNAIQQNANTYLYFDNKINNVTNYYRIKAISKNQEYSYSSILLVKININVPEVSIFPNPIVGNTIKITYNNFPLGNYNYSLTNNLGQKLVSENFEVSASPNNLSLDISKYESGVYYLIIEGEKTKIVKQIIR